MKNLKYILFVIILYSCKETKNSDLKSYVLNPLESDFECIHAVKQAKSDIAQGKIVFTYPCSLSSCGLRQEKYLILLCKKYDLIFDSEIFTDLFFEGQTQGCYGAVMDNHIADKLGADFKSSLLNAADSMLVMTNDTIAFFECDKRPQIPQKFDHINIHKVNIDEINLPTTIRKQLKLEEIEDRPFMDISFYIDKAGIASGYYLSNFVIDENILLKKFEEVFFQQALEGIQKIDYWVAGEIKGQKVNTENTVRVSFTE